MLTGSNPTFLCLPLKCTQKAVIGQRFCTRIKLVIKLDPVYTYSKYKVVSNKQVKNDSPFKKYMAVNLTFFYGDI